MGALDNASKLIKDATFLDQCMTAAAFQARQVVLEAEDVPNHLIRLDFAKSVISDPLNFRTRFAVYIATDPAVATKGATAALVGEQMIIDKAAEIWTAVAKLSLT